MISVTQVIVTYVRTETNVVSKAGFRFAYHYADRLRRFWEEVIIYSVFHKSIRDLEATDLRNPGGIYETLCTLFHT